MLINIEREAKYKSKEREKEKRNINYKRYVLSKRSLETDADV